MAGSQFRGVFAWLVLATVAGAFAKAETGSAICSGCHAGISNSYRRTPMALSSGRVGTGSFQEAFERDEFSHAPSGVRYRVSPGNNQKSFDFDLTTAGVRIRGSRPLEFFVGSGAVGRSYLFSIDRFLYQAPVSYYSSKRGWDLSPGYQNYDYLYLTRPVEPACLQCHASRLQPIAGTVNGFAADPFLEGGISCERCHGPGEDHVAKMKAGSVEGGSGIVNPRKLSAERRDSVCAQCHLSGVARIDKPGRAPDSFQAGALLSDYMSVFVWSGAPAEMKVTSHVEKLAQSQCKVSSGDRLWCGSCHDPHSVPPEAEKANYFRSKCLECHTTTAPCKAAPELRAQKGNSCIDCHMPKNPVIDVSHAAYTDHSIPRRLLPAARPPATANRILTPFQGMTASDRELGLAYALALEGGRNPVYEERAFELLKRAVTQRPNDVPALVHLAQLYGYRSDEENAVALYEKAVRLDPSQVVAASNLGAYLTKGGRTNDAIRLWSGVLERSPSFEAARLNLALAQRLTGDSKAAEATLLKGLALNPGAADLRKLLNQIRQP